MDPRDRDIDPSRRAWVLSALAAGLFAVPTFRHALAADGGGRSIHRLRGVVLVNDSPATPATVIRSGDHIETGADGEIVFTVADDAFILRRNARLELTPPAGDDRLVEGLRVVTGALLSVFARRPHRITAAVATIGIRGTGVYVEVDEDHDYVCTCYGVTEIATADDPASTATVEAGHHEARYVFKTGDSGQRIREAPFKNHTDAELTLIESLVGRVPAFQGEYEGYERPRRRTY